MRTPAEEAATAVEGRRHAARDLQFASLSGVLRLFSVLRLFAVLRLFTVPRLFGVLWPLVVSAPLVPGISGAAPSLGASSAGRGRPGDVSSPRGRGCPLPRSGALITDPSGRRSAPRPQRIALHGRNPSRRATGGWARTQRRCLGARRGTAGQWSWSKTNAAGVSAWSDYSVSVSTTSCSTCCTVSPGCRWFRPPDWRWRRPSCTTTGSTRSGHSALGQHCHGS